MSLYYTRPLTCPSCGAASKVDIFSSVNADRRPDLRQKVLDETLQAVTCRGCSAHFRAEPELNYLDARRGQWCSVHTREKRTSWEEILAGDMAAFDKSYGAGASASARTIGAGLTTRVTFGWAGFREKLVVAANGLDDCEIELLKIAILRTQDDLPLSPMTEMRLVGIAGDRLEIGWIDSETNQIVEAMLVPIDAYEEVAGDASGWADLRRDIGANPYVDLQRLLQ